MDSRYSRQMLSLGKSAQIKLKDSKVQVNNLSGGLGTEVCKNLVLQGIGTIYLSDNNKVTTKDIETGFYYVDSLGEERNKVLKTKLLKLNPSCNIFTSKEDIVDLDIFLNVTPDKVLSENAIIYSRVGGCRGFVFNDFKEHTISDVDGETNENIVIKNISSKGEVETLEKHNLCDGDVVNISKVYGENVCFLNKSWEVKVVNMFKFKINVEINNFKFTNGLMKKLKVNVNKHFNDLESELNKPTLPEDWMHPDKPQKLFDYWTSNELNPEDKLELGPVNSYFGGIIGSEAIKKITNMYTPIDQWYFWEDTSYLEYDETGRNNIEKIVGKDCYKKLTEANVFMVGSGAIGCEMLKNMSTLNVATSSKGRILVTDPDTIEVSNLSRQFLFHESDINKSKSNVACMKVKEFNRDINVYPYEDKMCKETEHKYNDDFYDNLDCLVNALDNYNARLYMDKKAVEYKLPLFESGTQGSKGNTQPVIPNVTVNYGATSDPPESESYPLCTLKNFPNKPEHVIHYMKEKFNEWFSDFVEKVNTLKMNKKYLDVLPDTERNLFVKKLNMFFKYSSKKEDQVEFWNEFYQRTFIDNILDIVNTYPEDHKVNGKLFWSNGKKCPKTCNSEYKISFIEKGLILSEILYGVKYDNYSFDKLNEIKPITGNKIAKDDKELEELEKTSKFVDLDVDYENIKELNEISFDKDINEHYNWLYVACLVRAKCYDIDFPDILQMRKIAGKIIPAMATTTSIVAGLVSLEYVKYFQNKKLEDYRSYFVNLAQNQYLFSEPEACKKKKLGNVEITLWDKFVEKEDLTLGELMSKYSKLFGVEITMLVTEDEMLYVPMMTEEENLDKKISNFLTNGRINCSNMEEMDLPEIFVEL